MKPGFGAALIVSAILGAALAMPAAAGKQPKPHQSKRSVTTILVKFERGAHVVPEAVVRAQGDSVIGHVGTEDVRLVKIAPGRSVDDLRSASSGVWPESRPLPAGMSIRAAMG